MKKKSLLDQIREGLQSLPPDDLRLAHAFVMGMEAAKKAAQRAQDPTPVSIETPGQDPAADGDKIRQAAAELHPEDRHELTAFLMGMMAEKRLQIIDPAGNDRRQVRKAKGGSHGK